MNTTDTSYFTKQEYIDPYEALGNAIILQAVADYQDATAYIKAYKDNPPKAEKTVVLGGSYVTHEEGMRSAYEIRREVRRFLHSRWFAILTGANGADIYDHIKIAI